MGYQVFNPVVDALSQFGGVEYKFKHPDGSLETFHFSLEDLHEKEDFEGFEVRVKKPLVIIGEAYRENLVIFISNSVFIFKFGDAYLSH
ncbi:SUKH-3 domain-containing protein [Lysinibacillus irui]|uniref:SUKH-3 domain-containing protein n=1 Tax=Lysinibacillus irui TaxID=2998077 RepID=A0AAJ5UTQ0_9BACI|nr:MULTISPECIES: SUKH-3 domain-containing protein [Lysinibacillus]WBF54520.1 SUKH-3 domain-containing protein [Lysinibacillus sp. JK80]WDV05470.1 SUKH-3 domain-containing protein [Lysinibacillus irui]